MVDKAIAIIALCLTALDAAGRALVTDLAEAHLENGGMIIAASHETLDFADAEVLLEPRR